MKKLLLLALLLYTTSLAAQTDTAYAYVDANYKAVKGWNEATYYYKAYKKDSTGYILSVHNRAGQLQKREIYLDAGLTIKNGQAVVYNDGKPTYKGIYINNEREGVFVAYDTLGHVLRTESYQRDTLDGPYNSYWPNASIKETGNYKRGKKAGEWILQYESGKPAIIEKFTDYGDSYSKTCFDESGKETTLGQIEAPPSFPGGIDKFYMLLARNVKYPPDAAEKHIEGEVRMSFLITETGAVENIRVERGYHPSLDAEALRVMKLSPKWIPGKLFGKPARVIYSIPIRFSLR
ncbi:energy transducer TonB [Pedobacter sp. ASV12]|uniref:energy transducer TonB n=1 Tax=Pedobacter sp. ASV12 TaxID=2795120 RepID=UPI0018ED73EF|nr:energy transducer TonB [Pedobacter sp. ASV12]